MNPTAALVAHLDYLRLDYVSEHYEGLAKEATAKNWTPVNYLQRLLEGDCLCREQRALERRIRAARFPVITTVDQRHPRLGFTVSSRIIPTKRSCRVLGQSPARQVF